MKLKHLFLAALAVGTFASCSNDGDVIDNTPLEPVDASVSFAASSRILTKADPLAESNEDFVNTLDVYIFKKASASDTDPKFVKRGHADANGKSITTINHITIKVVPNSDITKPSDDEFVAVLVANANAVEPTSLSDLNNKVLTNSIITYTPESVSEGTAYLPMVSETIEFDKLMPNVITTGAQKTYYENWINPEKTNVTIQSGDSDEELVEIPQNHEIELIRLVARVQVEKLILDINNENEAVSFTLTNLAMINVKKEATISNSVKEYVKGYQSEAYEVHDEWIDPKSAWTNATIPTPAGVDGALAKKYDAFKWNNNMWTPTGEDKFSCYVFENPEKTTNNDAYETSLLIAGVLKLSNAEDAVGEIKHFRIPLYDKAEPVKVKRNNVYKLTVTITGVGSKNEDQIEKNAHVSVAITVANWKQIDITEEDAN